MNNARGGWQGRRTELGWVTLLALFGAGVLGYHPHAEDGGLYLAEIKHLLDPALYPHGTAFVSGHLRVAGFSGGIAALVRWTGWSLPWIVLLLHGLSVWGLLVGAWQIACRCYAGVHARMGAVAAVALCLTMPVAGTSLMVMDPYLTARGISTALTVLGIAGLLEFLWCGVAERVRWGWLLWGMVAFTVAAAMHPLMAVYGAVETAMLLCLMSRRFSVQAGGIGLLVLLTMGTAALVQGYAPVETEQYRQVAATRAYWFLPEWRWFEWVGLAAPPAILGWVGWLKDGEETERGLARMGVLAGGCGLLLVGLFVREAGPVHAMARLQPLRLFHMVYLVMLMVLGGALGERVLRRSVRRWVLAGAVLSGVMFAVQRTTYPASDHLEMPWMRAKNGWVQAFLWVRGNTLKDALFALDSDYVETVGEDAQGFRAIAERSVLPDYSKDGGAASIRPELTQAWMDGQAAQRGLSDETDGERLRRLRGTGVSWVVLQQRSATGFDCPFANEAAKVCRLPADQGHS